MKRVEVRRGDVVLSCVEGGSGRPVVLLHGLAGSAQEMVPTAESLVQAGYRAIAVDQRGHGLSTRRPDDLSRAAYVRDVVAVIEDLAGGGPVSLVGQSMGGHTAMLVAAQHPALVHGLVMLEAGVGGDTGEGYPAQLGAWFAAWPVPFPTRAAAAKFLGPTALAQSWLHDLREDADGLRPRFDADIMEKAVTAVAERAHWDEWRSVRAPTLLVSGRRGNLAPDEIERMLELRPTAHHVVVPDAGHEVHLEQPAAWTSLLTDFLAAGELRDLLNKWDFIGVFDPQNNTDEYDCLIEPLLQKLAAGADAGDLSRFLDQEITDHFGMSAGLVDSAPTAERLAAWYGNRRSAG